MSKNKFYQAMYQAKLLYNISFTNEDDFAEIALNAWSIIGNKNVRIFKYIATPVDGKIELPCNCDIIEAVLAPNEDWDYTSNLRNDGNYESLWIEEYIEQFKSSRNPLYEKGHYVHYEQLGDTLYFEKNYPSILIIYKGIDLDEDGLPYINDKEMNAIAAYVAYVIKFKQGLATNNQGVIQASQILEKKWLIACDQARTPEYLSQNDLNEIADVKTSWNRKLFGKSYKPLTR